MQIKPRQHLLDIRQAIARQSFDGGEWAWGKRGGQSSVADVERLTCLLVDEQPGAACALPLDMLGQLDALARAGDAAARGM